MQRTYSPNSRRRTNLVDPEVAHWPAHLAWVCLAWLALAWVRLGVASSRVCLAWVFPDWTHDSKVCRPFSRLASQHRPGPPARARPDLCYLRVRQASGQAWALALPPAPAQAVWIR